MLEHGGRLLQASRTWGRDASDWLDLSTGINPVGRPPEAVPAAVWQRLPQDDDGLAAAASLYYDCRHLLPVAGSQAAIQLLPRLRRLQQGPARVIMVTPAYQEHAHCWQREGHQVSCVAADDIGLHLAQCDVLVLINPNNPTGLRWEREQLLAWRQELAARGGWLLVDEAFMDTTAQQSLCPLCGEPGLIVLRSLGKFFGLAGARVGFVAAWPRLLEVLQEQLGPWAVSGPSRYIATAALRDRQWQDDTRRILARAEQRLHALLTQAGLQPDGGTSLFQWVRNEQAVELYEAFARHGILLRLFTEPASLRFGLPADEEQWQRLQQVLTRVAEQFCPRERRA